MGHLQEVHRRRGQGGVVHDLDAGGERGFLAVGGQHGGAAVLGEIHPLGVHEHRAPVPAGGGHQAPDQLRGDQPLVVVGNQDHVRLGHGGFQESHQALEGIAAHGPAGLPVDAQDVLVGGDHAGLAGGGARGLLDHPPGVGPEGREQLQHAPAVGPRAHHTGDTHPGAQGSQVVHHVAGPPQGEVFPQDRDDLHRGLGGDAVHLPPEVFVDHQVAHDQHVLAGEAFQEGQHGCGQLPFPEAVARTSSRAMAACSSA